MKFNLFCSLDEDIWQVRIHFDAREPLEMKLCGSDITYLNLVAVMETQGFNAYVCITLKIHLYERNGWIW